MKWITVREAAERIGCAMSHVRALARQGVLGRQKRETDLNQHGYRVYVLAEDVDRYAITPQAKGYPRGRSRKGG